MTKLQKKFLDLIDEYGYDVFSIKMIKETEILSHSEINQAIRSLTKSKMLIRLERGKYVKYGFSEPFVIGSFLAKDGGIAYWSALNYHGLTEQFVNVVFVQTAKRSTGEKWMANTRYKFVKINERKLFGYIENGYRNHKYRITDLEKTIIDCFELPHLAGWYQEIIKVFYKAEINQKKLISYCKIINNKSVVKRLAFLTEFLKKERMNDFIKYALKTINTDYSLFEIDGEKAGKYNNRWKLIINMDEVEILEIANS